MRKLIKPKLTQTHYLVVSSMRSGSSAVGRVMHENMGITMYLRPPKPDDLNPLGYYEDQDVTDHNELCLRGSLPIYDHIDFLKRYAYRVEDFGKPWGLKDARMPFLGAIYKNLFPDARIIKLRRRAEDIVKSMSNKLGWSVERCKDAIFQNRLFVDAIWGDNIWASLDMTEKRSDEEIENAIRERTREI